MQAIDIGVIEIFPYKFTSSVCTVGSKFHFAINNPRKSRKKGPTMFAVTCCFC